ncbi:MAG: FAD-binding oxidoreductase [Deltaproteobacteria bacterium]|nr:FAD-binding oxidoreductase [Deltaproteobacteria bacterium]
MIPEDIAETASQCRHYAMCKIDFLGTGLCPAGEQYHYVSFYPQGRMDICRALFQGDLPVSEGLLRIADSCTLCGICDRQCAFVTGLRPLKVMAALKDHVRSFLKGGGRVLEIQEDPFLQDLRNIAGEPWATNDPAVLVCYSDDPSPMCPGVLPRYVVLPGSHEEVRRIVALCREHNLPYAVRGNGSSVMGFVMSPGLVLDMNRMKGIELDPENWCVRVEPGISAFDLQREVRRKGFRANTAEPSASVCANLMCSGIFSTFSHAYGTAADNVIDASFVGPRGNEFRLNERGAPNLFAFERRECPMPGICTGATVRLHPVTGDEGGIGVPFSTFEEAAVFCRELGMRRIGLAVGLLGGEYLSTFITLSAESARGVREALEHRLGIRFLVLVIGDRYARETVRDMAGTVMDQDLFRLLILGHPALLRGDPADLLHALEGNRRPYEILCRKEMKPLLEAALDPSPRSVARGADEDLRDFFEDLYSRPELSDLVWLHDFRIISARMGREKHVVAFVVYVPLDRLEVTGGIIEHFRRIGDRHEIKHDYGFLTPLDLGKRAVMEYDYYLDHTDPREITVMQEAVAEAGRMLDETATREKGVTWIRYLLYQGLCRKEGFLYT